MESRRDEILPSYIKKKEFNDGNGSLTKCINPVWFSVKKNENMLVFIYCKIKKLMGEKKSCYDKRNFVIFLMTGIFIMHN